MIRAELDPTPRDGGGDFHGPFWADAKKHARGEGDLTEMTNARIAENGRRERLYIALLQGFLDWWTTKRRWSNQPFETEQIFLSSNFGIPEIDVRLSVKGAMALAIGDSERKIVYPYFAEDPLLDDKWGRVALALLHNSFAEEALNDLRVLDVIRSRSFAGDQIALKGDEVGLFTQRYEFIRLEYERLKLEYIV